MTSIASARGNDIVVVHSSDLHIDDDYTARLHGGDGTRGLAVVLKTACELAADVVILAGDTFDSHRLSAALLERTAKVIAAAALPVVLLPGNHDPAIAEAVYYRDVLANLSNLHVLGATREEEAIVFAEFDLEVWGCAHRHYGDMVPFERPRARATTWQIAVGHGHYEPQPDRTARLRPSWLIGDDELRATSADYIALGHWNRAAQVGAAAYYSGSPEYAGSVNVVRLTGCGQVVVRRAALQIAREPSATDYLA
jgi:DNA repair exonuclease SbcCD nuclease subunit